MSEQRWKYEHRRGSRILKWGVNFLHLNKRNQIFFQYLRDKKKKIKKGAQKKGSENSPISPPWIRAWNKGIVL